MSSKEKETVPAEVPYHGLCTLDELEIKCVDAEERLGKNFGAFIRTADDDSYFICGGDVVSTHISNNNFRCAIVGASAFEVNFIEQQIMSIGSEISSLFSGREFHGTVASTYLSEYLRDELYNLKIPRATAGEVLMFDRSANVTKILYSGDLDVDYFYHIEKPIIIGCYDKEMRGRLEKELEGAPKEISKEKLQSFSGELVKKLELRHIYFLHV